MDNKNPETARACTLYSTRRTASQVEEEGGVRGGASNRHAATISPMILDARGYRIGSAACTYDNNPSRWCICIYVHMYISDERICSTFGRRKSASQRIAFYYNKMQYILPFTRSLSTSWKKSFSTRLPVGRS